MSPEATILRNTFLKQERPLLTPDLEALRLDALVVEPSVKGDPRTPPGDKPLYKESRKLYGELEAVRQSILNPYDIHAMCEGAGRLALIRKMSPHGMNEMTVMAQDGYDEKPVDTLFDFAPEVRDSFYKVGGTFGEFAEGKGLYPVVSYTYDPLTDDRKSAQSVKIFHLQLTARSDEELGQMRQGVRPLSDVEPVQRRQLIDESSVVFSLALTDYLTANQIGSLIPNAPFVQDTCSNVRFDVGDSWEDITTKDFDHSVRALHEAMVGLHQDLAEAAMTGESGLWERPVFSQDKAHDHIEGLGWMQSATREIMHHFISGLPVEYWQDADKLRELELTAHVYPLAGLAYATAINKSKSGKLMLSIRPQLFAETGGTGLQYLDPLDAHVKVRRGTGMYSPDELAEKTAFEKECAAYVSKRSLSVHA